MPKKTSQSITAGDHVEWNTPQGKTEGTVTRKHTTTAQAGGHTAKPSSREPQFEVKSEKTGKTAIHKPEALKKTRKRSSEDH